MDPPASSQADGAHEEPEPVTWSEPEPLAVIGGSPSTECAFPSTVRVAGASRCTGTLIHPRVVITAAHCISKSGTTGTLTIGFGEQGSPAAFSVTARCQAGARGGVGSSTNRDWGYCILPEDPRVALQPTTPPLAACEARRFLKPAAKAMVVGYGVTHPSQSRPSPKRQVEVAVQRLEAGLVIAGDQNVGACFGDSGGPLYMRLVDESGRDHGWRVIASTSGPDPRVRGCRCNCETAFVNVAEHVAAIEANERIDVTPCTDAAGSWSPGPGCTKLPADIDRLAGKFPHCQVPVTTQPIESCGANPG